MKTLIAYATTHGCTEKTAQELKTQLGGEVTLVNLKKNPNLSVNQFDRVIIGGSIHAGQIQKRLKEFCAKNLELLKEKELGLFICCMEQGETAGKQFTESFPEELQRVAKSTAIFGGEFDFEKMKFLEKMIVKKLARVKQSTSKIDQQAIRKFSKRMDRIFNPFLFLA